MSLRLPRPSLPLWTIWFAAAVPFAVFLVSACSSPEPLADGPAPGSSALESRRAGPAGIMLAPLVRDRVDAHGFFRWAVADDGTILHTATGGS